MAKFTNKQQAAFAEKAVSEGWKYWYGTCGYPATQSLFKRKKEQYPSHYKAAREATYKKHIEEGRTVADCVGLIKAFFWTSNGTTEAKYGVNNCPDQTANGMFKLCKTSGDIDTIPSVPGLVVWNDGHIGVSLDGQWAIEARNFEHGVVKTRIKDRKWTNWGKLPASMLDYVDGEDILTEPETPDVPAAPDPQTGCPYAEPAKTLRKGEKGEGVKWVQWMLNACKYNVGSRGIDGDFGSATLSAVQAFQTDHGLTVDGIVGKKTRAGLKEALKNPTVKDDAAQEAEPEETPGYAMKGKIADLSQWHGEIDWTAAARELDFCILRAQYGHERADAKYLEHAKGCEAMHIPYGASSYCLFDDVQTAREEARFLAERVKDTHPSFLALDIEEGGVPLGDIREAVEAYVAELRALGFERVGLYFADHAYPAYGVERTCADFLWLACYGGNSGKPEKKPEQSCDLWQFTSLGLLGGVKEHVHLNQLMDESCMVWFRGEA